MPDPIDIIKAVGLLGIFMMVFSESGMFFGFFLPGDSLLFSAGLIASNGFFDIKLLIIGCIIAAILGDTVGYWMGRKMGPKLFYKDKGFFFRKKRIDDAEAFYKKHGVITIIIARFIPVVRTFAPIVAGMGKMKYNTFITYNILGGIFWVLLLTLFGYFLGMKIPDPDTYILPIVIGIIGISILPLIYKMATNDKRR